MSLPPQGQWLRNEHGDNRGLIRWRAAFDTIRVFALPDGARRIELRQDGVEVFAETLSREQAEHLALCLGQALAEAAPSEAA